MGFSVDSSLVLQAGGESSALSGANSRDRTDDLRITNALLYQLSYVGLEG
jgi:hypothetical protein